MSRIALLFACACVSVPFAALGVAATSVDTAGTVSRINFSISPQSLSTALIALGQQTNVQVLTSSGTIATFRSDGVNGILTPDAALADLLEGTGLSYAFIDSGTVVVKPRAPASNGAFHVGEASASASVADAKLLAPIRVNGVARQDSGYMVDTASAASILATA